MKPYNSTNAERCKAWRAKLKNDPGRYAVYKEQDVRRQRQYCKRPLSEEQLERRRELNRLCQKKYREKWKNTPSAAQKRKKKPLTRKAAEALKKYNREAKRKQRSKLHPQKKRRIREKDQQYKRKKATEKLMKKKLTRKKKNPKENPYETVLQELNQALQKDKTDEGKIRKRLLATILSTLKKYKLMKKARKNIGLRWQTVVKLNQNSENNDHQSLTIRRKWRQGIAENVVKLIQQFYQENSTPRPDERSVSKRTNFQRRDLDKTGRELFKTFKKDNQNISISFSSFWNHRPAYIKPLTKKPHISCLCEYCTNIELKIKLFNEIARTKQVDTIQSKYHLNTLMLCPTNSRKCIESAWSSCGVPKLKELLFWAKLR